MLHPPRILIVEDEQVVAMDLRTTLSSLGYEVTAVTDSAHKAVKLAEEESPDLVLMDIRLQGKMDGIGAADEITQRLRIPVVFVTAYISDETLARASASGPFGYLTKPFRTKDLNATITVALRQHRLTQQLFEERTWFTKLLATLSDSVIATDSQGSLRFMNERAERLTGWSLQEAAGKPAVDIYQLYSFDNAGERRFPLSRALKEGLTSSRDRLLVRARDGRETPAEVLASPIMDEAGQVVGAVLVLFDITEQLHSERRQAAERDRLEEQVQATTEALGSTRAELRTLAANLMTAQEEERRRVARELHDDLTQRASLAEFYADRLNQLLPDAKDDIAGVLVPMRKVMAQLSDGLRDVSHRLHPSALEDLGLEIALRGLADDFQAQGVDVLLSARDVPGNLAVPVATVLFRIAQEAVRNVQKHAAGATVCISLTRVDGSITLQVEDSGPGFDINTARAKRGLGLLSMQERARQVGGSLQLRTHPGQGTTLVVDVPL